MKLERRIDNLEAQTIAAGQPQLVVIVEGEGVPEDKPYIRVVSEEARPLTLRILAGEGTG